MSVLQYDFDNFLEPHAIVNCYDFSLNKYHYREWMGKDQDRQKNQKFKPFTPFPTTAQHWEYGATDTCPTHAVCSTD